MSYTKQSWKKYDELKTEEENIQDGAVVTDDRMNHIESGIGTNDSSITAHIENKTNPHGVTKAQVGLSNVDNAQQATKTEFDTHTANTANPHAVTASQVGTYSKSEIDTKLTGPFPIANGGTGNTQGLAVGLNTVNLTKITDYDALITTGQFMANGFAHTNVPTNFDKYSILRVAACSGGVVSQVIYGNRVWHRYRAGATPTWTPWVRLDNETEIVAPWTTLSPFAKYKRDGDSVTIAVVGATKTTAGDITLGTIPTKDCPSSNVMGPAISWSANLSNDRHLQINGTTSSAKGGVTILSAAANQEYTFQFTYQL